MNRKQWFIFGIGFILLGLLYGYSNATLGDCTDTSAAYFEMMWENRDLPTDVRQAQNNMLSSAMDSWTIFCLEQGIFYANMSTLGWTLGIMFLIAGFLEQKVKQSK